MIIDNVMVYSITLPADLQGDNLNTHLIQFDEKALGIIAGFNKNFLEHFLILSKGKSQADLKEILKKMEKVSYMIGPMGNLNYLGPNQIEHVLTKLGSLKLNEITEEKIGLIGDEQLQQEFGGGGYDVSQAIESQLSSASFYLIELGYPKEEIQEKLNEARQDPSKLDALFNLLPKEIMSLPPELQQGGSAASGAPSGSASSGTEDVSIDRSQATEEAIASYIQQIQRDHPPERAQKVTEAIEKIKAQIKEHLTEDYVKVLRQMHPDRINRAFKMLKNTKKKSKKIPLLLEWFFCSHLIESIEFKVEHWQVSSAAGHGRTGVYTAGILFSRYDQIVNDFPDGKLAKVINIARKILITPSKKAIQRLGQDLVAETGFDEHLYFTD